MCLRAAGGTANGSAVADAAGFAIEKQGLHAQRSWCAPSFLAFRSFASNRDGQFHQLGLSFDCGETQEKEETMDAALLLSECESHMARERVI